MRHRLLKVFGFSLLALAFVGIGLSILLALLNGKPNVGTNYYGLPIGTYSTACVMVVVIIVLLVVGAVQAFRLLKHWARR